jgi:hypothetical protein
MLRLNNSVWAVFLLITYKKRKAGCLKWGPKPAVNYQSTKSIEKENICFLRRTFPTVVLIREVPVKFNVYFNGVLSTNIYKIGSSWLRIGTGRGLLWIRWWTFGFSRHGVSLSTSITQWSTVRLEKLRVQEIPCFCGTWRLHAMFNKTRKCTLPWLTLIREHVRDTA